MKGIINSLLKNWRSYRFAIQGIRYLVKSENNFRIQLICGTLVIIFGFVFHLDSSSWLLLIVMIGLVLMAEALNTSIEKLADKVQPAYDPDIALIKDLAATGVLLISTAASIVGVIVFVSAILSDIH